jgi:two-component system cell cycle sensor histidine kinase/response regulator CckA
VPTILVVEDDPIVRNVIVHILTRQGLLVFEANSCAEAINICKSLRDEPLDVLISSHPPSPSSGRETALRILEHCPNIAVLHLSPWSYSYMEAAGELLPGSSYLQKPFTAGQLVSAVQGILDPRTQ